MSGKRKASNPKPTESKDAGPAQQRPSIDVAEFVATWNGSATLRDAAETMGLKASTCANYADRLRQAGHALKEFLRGRPRLLKM
jgi:transposase